MADLAIIVDTRSLVDAKSKLTAFQNQMGKTNSVLGLSRALGSVERNVEELIKAQAKGQLSSLSFQHGLLEQRKALEAMGMSSYMARQRVEQLAAALRNQQAARVAAQAADEAARATKRLADRQLELRMRFQEGYADFTRQREAMRSLREAYRSGIITLRQYEAQLARIRTVNQGNVRGFNKFGMYSQQVGYQVGDFAVQVQSGTDALVAFGQQGTQLAGLLPGLTGAVLGIGLAIGTAVARSVLDAKKLEIDFKAVINELKKPLESIKPIMDAVSSAFKSTGGVAVSAISTIANNLDRVVLYITVAAAAFGTKLVAGLIAARVATFTLAGAFAFLRTAIIRTGIGAIIIGIAEAIRMFMLLSKQVGGVGPLLQLLKDAFFEVLDKVGLMFQWLGLMAKATFFGILKDSLEILSDLLSKVNSNFVNKFIGMFAGAIGAVAEYIKSLPDIFVAVFQMVKKAVADGVNSFTGIIGDGINNLRGKVGLDAADFGQLIDTSGMVGGDVAGVLANTKANISSAYQRATAIDYVTTAQNNLNSAINDADRLQQGALSSAVSVDAAIQNQGAAVGQLVDAYNKLGNAAAIDPSKMLRPQKDKDKSKAEDPLEKIRREIQAELDLKYVQEDRYRVIKALGKDANNYSEQQVQSVVNLAEASRLANEQLEKMQGLSDSIASSMASGFMSIVDGTKTAKDAFRDMARDIIKQLYNVLVVQQLVGSFDAKTKTGTGLAGMIIGAFQANGGAWSGGSQIQAYANGGVVGGPTTFPMAGGKTGLMGEAGPEAIMPLKRGANGKLGVQMEGGGGDTIVVNQSFNFQANGDDSVKRIIAQAAPQIAQMTKKSMIDDRRRGGQMKATFG